MEHIRQFDWCYSKPDIYFLKEDDLANSVTEKIIRNKFRDPLISSESDEEPININWDEIFTKKDNQNRQHRVYVPCIPAIQYPKLSSLTGHQHYQCIKVICAQYPHVMEQIFIPKPTKADYKTFEELKPVYEKEQKEYIEWARNLWTNGNCVRALRPKPQIETVYEASFKMREKEMESYPKTFDMAAQIPLETRNNTHEMLLDKELINVDIKDLPEIECRPITSKFCIIKPCSVPEPCNKHPCKFILPNEKSVTILPLTEVHRELAQYASDNNAQYVASENALQCLVELDRSWDITVSVSSVFGPDGETTNIVVLGNEFSVHRESCLTRTYRSFCHLIQNMLVPRSEKQKLQYKQKDTRPNEGNEIKEKDIFSESMDVSSDDEDDNLCIIDFLENQMSGTKTPEVNQEENEPLAKTLETSENTSPKEKDKSTEDIGFYNCTCKDTNFERPPPRSFRKWRIKNGTTNESFDIVVHCSHKVRDKSGEVILEPIPEYQLDLGASEQSKGRIRSLMLALFLRKNASLINVRADGATGEVVMFEKTNFEEMKEKHSDVMNEVTNILHSALEQLQGLVPGHYILRHEPSHGSNALLFVAKPSARAGLVLDFDCTQLAEADEANNLKTPPIITPMLLPFHKQRRVLPCAFTPHEQHVSKQPARLRAARAPPRALQWPKKKKKSKAKN